MRQIIDAVGIAKGTFYHYFDSKAALLDAVIERSLKKRLQQLAPLVGDPQLDAAAKFEQICAELGGWKLANKAFFIEMLELLYRDDNALLRAKMHDGARQLLTPLLAEIVQQGVREGLFVPQPVQECAELIFSMGQGLSDSVAHMLLAGDEETERWPILEQKFKAHERAIERLLGAAPGSIHIYNLNQVRQMLT